MFETFLLVLAIAAQSVSPPGAASSGGVAVAESAAEDTREAAAETAGEEPATAPASPGADLSLGTDETAGLGLPVFPTPAPPELRAQPQVPTGKFTTALEVKPILNATRGNWIAVREFNGQDLVYVTHLWSWRCGLLELRIGINGATPEPWPLPQCRLDQPAPNAMLEEDGLPYRAFAPGSVSRIDVQITYDDLDTDSASFDRQGVLIP